MGFLDRLRTRIERRRGVLALETVEDDEPGLRLPETTGTPQLGRPEPTPSMQVRDFGGTAGTGRYRTPHGTPSTERLHNSPRDF